MSNFNIPHILFLSVCPLEITPTLFLKHTLTVGLLSDHANKTVAKNVSDGIFRKAEQKSMCRVHKQSLLAMFSVVK